MMGRKVRKIIYAMLSAFLSTGAMNCSDTLNILPENKGTGIVNLTHAKDNVILSKGFTLNRDMEVKIVCLGEGIFDDMADYGWIIDADTRKKIWIMNYELSKNAGGAKKNRIAEENIFLKKGSYVAYYKTDDSHSYERWNDTPPADESKWGLSISVAEYDDIKYVSLFDDENYKGKNLLVEIVQVKDNDFRTKTFKLDDKTNVKVYAVGEGTRSGMFDYGWIENESGHIVWKMTYKNTVYAGGAVKNRIAIEALTLPAGEYKMFYETDDSHSFNSWNANPPEDALRYGITLTTDDTIMAGRDQTGD